MNQHEINENILAWATLALAVVTLALAIFTGLMWWWTRKLAKSASTTSEMQYEQTQRSLRLAEESNKLTRDMFIAENRPWIAAQVSIASALTNTEQDGWHIAIGYTIRNVGKGPAAVVAMSANIMPHVIDCWTEAELKGRSALDMPILGTDTFTELKRLAGDAPTIDKGARGFGKTLFPGDSVAGTHHIHAKTPLFERTKTELAHLTAYTGQFNLLFSVSYGFTFDETRHVTAKAFTFFKRAGADGKYAKIDLNGERVEHDDLILVQYPDSRTDYAT